MQEFAARKFCCIHPGWIDTQYGRLDWTTLRSPNFRSGRSVLKYCLATRANAHVSLLQSLAALDKATMMPILDRPMAIRSTAAHATD
jgi:hypothetical protein